MQSSLIKTSFTRLGAIYISFSMVLATTAAGAKENGGSNDVSSARVVKFISCPVYRDTDAGIKSGCWLATDLQTGIVYDVSGGRTKPRWGSKVLVEGVVGEESNNCGGLLLKPVRTSVLDETCPRHILSAEEYPGNRFVLPKRIMLPTDVPRQLPPPPYGPKEYNLYFDFNSDFLAYQYSEVMLEEIMLYIEASRPKRVMVTGFAATSDYAVSGRLLTEKPQVAQQRAAMVTEALRRLGVDSSLLIESTRLKPSLTADGDQGLFEPSRRRVTIEILF